MNNSLIALSLVRSRVHLCWRLFYESIRFFFVLQNTDRYFLFHTSHHLMIISVYLIMPSAFSRLWPLINCFYRFRSTPRLVGSKLMMELELERERKRKRHLINTERSTGESGTLLKPAYRKKNEKQFH